MEYILSAFEVVHHFRSEEGILPRQAREQNSAAAAETEMRIAGQVRANHVFHCWQHTKWVVFALRLFRQH